ncbi:MAG: hypothetical protein RBR52_11880 [Thiomonas sp.]|uniref:hypothetical protein n=1 Tax=Thiomonas sp. TaxID=2047785 RepID=UPI002A35E2F9|nr:hypothetical protein [Thiomonas sp.]MDY0331176.1 hypothetical protein [Thiomonas sp.]
MQIADFADFLQAAKQQPQPQRLYFVFATIELPEDASPAQRTRHAAGGGGALVPVMAVDKSPHDLPDFETLAEESRYTGTPWDMVFVTTQTLPNDKLPDDAQVEQTLTELIESIRLGQIDHFLTFDKVGRMVRLI